MTTLTRAGKAMTEDESRVRDLARARGYRSRLKMVVSGGRAHFEVSSVVSWNNILAPDLLSVEEVTIAQTERFVLTIPVDLACKLSEERHAQKVQLSDQGRSPRALDRAGEGQDSEPRRG